MSSESTWDFSKEILSRRFASAVHPFFFGNQLTADDHSFRRGKPFPYLHSAIELLKKMHAKTIVEIGSMRQPMQHTLEEFNPVCCNEGHSTAFWASSGLAVHTCDVEPIASQITAAACAASPNVKVYCGDGIQFLKEFPGPIDLLYLDAWDAIDGVPFAEKHLEAYQAARTKMSPASIVLIDDTDIAFGGKGRLAVPAVIRDGFDLLLTGRQTMLLRL